MPVFHVTMRTTITTASVPLAALRGDTNQRVRIREIKVFQETAGTSPNGLALVRSTALGTGALTSVTPVMREPRDTVTSALGVTAWATLAPTTGGAATAIERFVSGVAVGNGAIWSYDRLDPLIIEEGDTATGELVFLNLFPTVAPNWQITITAEV